MPNMKSPSPTVQKLANIKVDNRQTNRQTTGQTQYAQDTTIGIKTQHVNQGSGILNTQLV